MKLGAIPKAIVFDLGKVLVDFDYSLAAEKIASLSKVDMAEVRKLIDQSPLLVEFETGRMNTEAFYSEVCRATGFCGDQAQFNSFFADIFTAIPEMIELHARLRKRVPTFVFSNTNDIAIRHIKTRFPFFAGFEGYVFSYEHGAMKPDRKLYQVVEQRARYSGDELLYIDDRKENVDVGAQHGWQVIWHQTPQETLGIIEKIGLV